MGAGLKRVVHDLAGKKFGRLTAIERTKKPCGKEFRAAWRVRCDCGSERVVYENCLLKGKTISCGCYFIEVRASGSKKTHGLGKKGQEHPLLCTWNNMIARCYSVSVTCYRSYGGRGITVCDRWRFGEHGKLAFECFLEDVGAKPTPEHTLDRIDVNGNYEPGNCRWATRQEQNLNTRASVKRALIAELHASGLSASDIALKMGRQRRSITRTLKRLSHV